MKKILFSLITSLLLAYGASAQYCTPTCTYPAGGCMYGRITLFKVNGAFSTILYDSTGCTGSGYENHTADSMMSCTLVSGGTYTLNMTTTGGPNMTQIWIDYNNDYVFDSSEIVGGQNSWMTGTTLTFIVPSYASAGMHRMRMVNEYAGMTLYPNMNPCMGTGYMYADARDYMVYVSSTSSCTGTPVAGYASASLSGSCGYYNLLLNDSAASSGTGITYQWQSSVDGGATWVNMSGLVSITEVIAVPSVNTIYRCIVSCGSYSATSGSASFTVPNKIYGNISFSSAAPDTISLKVWLINFDSTAGTVYAVDSVITTCTDSMSTGAYFEFDSVPSATYFVKAKSLDYTSSTPGASGFVPTYGYNSPYWGGATRINYTSGSVSQNINMVWGTVTSGPGFIGGYISSGAGKGTSGDIPDRNVLVFLRNTATGIVTQTYTDTAGIYAFSSLAFGTYVVYPEVMGYATIPSPSLTLSSTATSVTGMNFKQYNTSKIVKPITTSIENYFENTIAVFPSPSHGILNIRWDNNTCEKAALTITDISGRIAYSDEIILSGNNTNVNLSSLTNGIYFVTIKTPTLVYNEKLVIQK